MDAPPPPVVVQPAPRQVSFGLVSGTVGAGTARILVRVGTRTVADRPLRGRRFSLRVDLPLREANVTVVAVARDGRRSATRVGPVLGLPRAAEPRARAPRNDPALARVVRSLAAGYGGVAGAYVESLDTGAGAAWNARARFPAASALKLAISVAVLRAHDGVPAAGSRVDVLLRRMLIGSDNEAANELETWLGGGSLLAGSARVNETVRGIGLADTEMYGGYEIERRPQGPIPIRVERAPAFGRGKYSSPADLARLAKAVWLAAAGRGPLVERYRGAFHPAESRHLLFLLGRVGDRGKLGRELPPGALLLHKAGWISTARLDCGLVVWPGGAFVAAVAAWSPRGAGAAADVLAGRVARAAYARLGA